MRFSFLRIFWRDVRGSVLIEGAIIFPVLFVLFFGVFEFSWFFYEQHRVSTGLRDAARYIARTVIVDATVQSNAKSLALSGDTSGSCTVSTTTTCRVKGWTDPDSIHIEFVSVDCAAPYYCQGGATTMQGVKVWTSFTPSSLGFLGFLRLGPLVINNLSHTERIVSGGA
jgi:Flp pilus assembly protein TadG